MSGGDDHLQIDFTSLAIHDEDFAKIYEQNDGLVDFQDPKTLQDPPESETVLQEGFAWTCASPLVRFPVDNSMVQVVYKRPYFPVHREFGLKLELPNDRLCPPVPVRYEYIRWMQKLLDSTSDEYTDTYDRDRAVIGIDIGVGSSCIYPLLGCARRENWRFGGTDIDNKNLEYASRNITINDLQSRVRLKRVDPTGPIIALDTLGIKQADFVMCNPPFYRSNEDMADAESSKDKPPPAVCTGADVEMICEGGDLGFVSRMVEESRKLEDSVQWYSSMLGKLGSVTAVVARLKEIGITNWAVTALQAGKVTKRWAVAWSYGDMRPRNDVARGNLTTKEILPFPTQYTIRNLRNEDEAVTTCLKQLLDPLELKLTLEETSCSCLCLARENVWSRAARRKKTQEGTRMTENEEEDEDEKEIALATRITKLPSRGEVVVRWLQGRDSVLFESFCGMLKRELSKRCGGMERSM